MFANKSKFFSDLIIMTIGNFLLALGVATFIIPQNILSGGVAGIAVALQPILRVDSSIIINVLVISLFVVGFIVLGKEYAIKTIYSSIVYPFFLNILLNYDLKVTDNPLIGSIYAGIICGVGIGMVIRIGSSTGGMDIPPLILAKFTHISVAKWVFVIDFLTVLLGTFVYGVEEVLIGALCVYTTSKAINYTLLIGGKEANQLIIISDKYEEIIKEIHQTMDRGCTILNAKGSYTNSDKKVILAVILKQQYPKLSQLINKIDPDAFVTVSEVTEVKGRGFSFDHRV